ncbi:testis-expressed protein 101 isoform X2 [Erinaceus europaeus]|uniref:Testis-expressed protein 101 isoform X2 n=1 Tax=Erinaceus europaeus TaxID=9365 RepID=A0ABM3WZL2_ERIEU|nr:testis-expressed protein 101 isoform X2 [Erinaceus europaeus]
MGACQRQGLLLLLLLGASSLPLVQNIDCHEGILLSVEEDPRMLNWSAGQADRCDNGTACQESVLLIKAGNRTAVLSSKGCVTSDMMNSVTYIQHSPPPGIVTVSYSNYCDEPLCNKKNDFLELWNPRLDAIVSSDFRCPTCVALGTCTSAPSRPCPNGTTQCYQGKLQITGGGISSQLEVKGCSSFMGCQLMSGVLTIGPMWVKEVCPYESLRQSRRVENGGTSLPVSVWRA